MTTQGDKAPPKVKNTDFYIGYGKRLPEAFRLFLPVVMVLLVAGFSLLGLATGITQNDPGEGGFRWDQGAQTLVGVLEVEPVPVVHAPPTARYPHGHSMMLVGQGKVGVQVAAAPLAGKVVNVAGVVTERGALDMLVVETLQAAAGEHAAVTLPPVTDLGRWRLTGEICDGKCAAGAMRPGTGIAHKACANLCLFGGTPPVFVANGAVAGHGFFLLADKDGQPLDGRLLDVTAVPVEIEGRIEQRGDLPVMLIDVEKVRRR